MKKSIKPVLCWIALCTVFLSCKESTDKTLPEGLLCEYISNALGTDARHPRLMWKTSTTKDGYSQTAYHVIVGTGSAQVSTGNGDMWDSQKSAAPISLLLIMERHLSLLPVTIWIVYLWDLNDEKSDRSAV